MGGVGVCWWGYVRGGSGGNGGMFEGVVEGRRGYVAWCMSGCMSEWMSV